MSPVLRPGPFPYPVCHAPPFPVYLNGEAYPHASESQCPFASLMPLSLRRPGSCPWGIVSMFGRVGSSTSGDSLASLRNDIRFTGGILKHVSYSVAVPLASSAYCEDLVLAFQLAVRNTGRPGTHGLALRHSLGQSQTAVACQDFLVAKVHATGSQLSKVPILMITRLPALHHRLRHDHHT